MFLELSFDSRAGDKEVSASKAARSWRYDNDDQQEMSLDELISDFRQSATSRRSKLDESVSRSEASPLQVVSPPKHSKAKESGKKNRSFADRARITQRESTTRRTVTAVHKDVRGDDSSDDDGAVMPMPRLEQVLRNKPSLLPKRRVPPVAASARLKTASRQSRKPPPSSPVLSSPSLSPESLSPVTSSSAASSPLSMPEEPVTPDEDSIDALIGKDIRELNKLIAVSSRGNQKGTHAAKSPSSDEITQVLRQNTRFGTKGAKNLRPRLQLQMPRGSKSRPESPPPPPPPDDDDDDSDEDEEDSFAEEIRKLRESRRLNSLPVKAPEKEDSKDEVEPTSSEFCATAALKVRNASNAINGLLLEALKPFEDRKREEDAAEALEKVNAEGDSAIRKAAQAELQTATQTIVSQLDLTFADMTERRKADLKAEADAAAAAKDAEKKEKEAADEKKKADEKEAKQREMDILRMIPMQGKLLTCSVDIENVLVQLETMDASTVNEPAAGALSMEEEIKSLRSHTQRKIEAIEARMMAGSTSTKAQSGESSGISWRAVDWVKDNFEMNQTSPASRGDDNQQVEATVSSEVNTTTTEEEGPLQEVLQRHVLEKLDLTMLKLKHVLAVDAKESAEIQAKHKREEEERAKQLAQQQLEDERKQQELEDAENARRRVMGLTSLDDVEGWIEEGRQLHDKFDHGRTLNRFLDSLENHMNEQNTEDSSPFMRTIHPNQEEALRQFDYLSSVMPAQNLNESFVDEEDLNRRGHRCDEAYESQQGRSFQQRTQVLRPRQTSGQRVEISRGFRESEGESSGGCDSDEGRQPVMSNTHRESKRNAHGKKRSPLPSPSAYTRIAPSIRRDLLQHDASNTSEYEGQRGKWRSSPRGKKHSRRHGAGRHQVDIGRTIQALQADRRQKTAWIQSHRRLPPSRSPHYNSALL